MSKPCFLSLWAMMATENESMTLQAHAQAEAQANTHCEMPEDLPEHLAVRDGGDDPQRPLLTLGAARHSERKHPLQQSRPAP